MKNLNLYQKIILLTVTFFMLVIVVAIFREDGILDISEFEDELTHFKIKNEDLKDKNQNLRDDIDTLKSDPFAIEVLAREKLNMVRPGETVYQFVLKNKPTLFPIKK